MKIFKIIKDLRDCRKHHKLYSSELTPELKTLMDLGLVLRLGHLGKTVYRLTDAAYETLWQTKLIVLRNRFFN